MNFKSSIVGFTRKAIYAKHFPHSVFPPRLHCFEIEITTVSISLSISLFFSFSKMMAIDGGKLKTHFRFRSQRNVKIIKSR